MRSSRENVHDAVLWTGVEIETEPSASCNLSKTDGGQKVARLQHRLSDLLPLLSNFVFTASTRLNLPSRCRVMSEHSTAGSFSFLFFFGEIWYLRWRLEENNPVCSTLMIHNFYLPRTQDDGL